jgi:asparagine synthase (glutamine-hydrolysing)
MQARGSQKKAQHAALGAVATSMCGIVGKLSLDGQEPVDADLIERMTDALSHRGPDGAGAYVSGPIGLGHRRLSIIDLSSSGAQPMCNEDKSVWIVFNGEIYNFKELRHHLLKRGHTFRSTTDTEVIIHLYEEYGIDCLTHLRGMFAFAIWDSRRRRLFLARDRVGIKPLYYCQARGSLYFASELKSIIVDAAVAREINPAAVRQFLSFFYVPRDETLFRSVKRLLPGNYLIAERGKVTTGQYWDLRFTKERWSKSFDDAVEELRELLASTVRDHMIADVPVGVLLSGGMDSSAVLNFAVQQTGKKISTFTVGFSEQGVVDERPYARLVSDQFGTEHHEISISAEDFWDFLPSYVWHMEEPVCEPPAVALHYVSKLARNHVKVVLSGEGGDEAFAGYPNYWNMLRLDRLGSALGPLARSVGGTSVLASRVLGLGRVHRYGAALGRPLADHYFSRTSSPSALFNQDARRLLDPEFFAATEGESAQRVCADLLESAKEFCLLDQMLYLDTKTWLPDDLLVKADKITMANSLELRVPLLDHAVLEFAASLPPEYKVYNGQTKLALKAVFSKVLPEQILTRKKAGFPIPYDSWLRSKFRDGVRDTLLSDRALSRGYFRKSELQRLLCDHQRTGKYPKEVFSLLVLELWHRNFIDQSRIGFESHLVEPMRHLEDARA